MNNGSNFNKYAIGFLLGTVGVSVATSKIAQKAYRYLFAGAFIAKDSVMETVEKLQAGTMDIAEDAKVIVEKYYAEQDAEYDAAAAESAE